MGKLMTLQMSASPALSQQVDSFAQVLLLDEFMLFTCKDNRRSTQYTVNFRQRQQHLTTNTMQVNPFSCVFTVEHVVYAT